MIPVRPIRVYRIRASFLHCRSFRVKSTSRVSFSTFTTMASSIPKQMAGVIIEKTGGLEVLQYKTDLPVPEPKEGEILVKNEYIGVNYIDNYYRTGLYKAPSFPYILGREAAGTVVATGPGNVHGIKPGQRVAWMGVSAYAEYAAAPAMTTLALPDAVSTADAAAALIQGLTALTLIREAHPVRRDDWVLVHAAAGGTGLWLCQLLRATGARTIGTASTAEKMELARKAGAEVLVNYTREDVAAKVREVTGGEGVVAVFDGVGKDTFDLSMECLARKGSMVTFGNSSGAVPPIAPSILAAKNIKLLRPVLFGYVATRAEFEHYASELLQLMEEHNIDVRIHEIYPLKEVARAHQDIEGRKTTGKLLLKL